MLSQRIYNRISIGVNTNSLALLKRSFSVSAMPRLEKLRKQLEEDDDLLHSVPSIIEERKSTWTRADYDALIDSTQVKFPNNVLTDNHSRTHTYLRISLTEKCNFRCLYCMPEEGIDLSENTEILTPDEIHRVIELFAEHGVTKLRFTGGEPLLVKNLPEYISQAKKMNLQDICMTTNGLTLHRKLDNLVERGLTGVNISLDTWNKEKFEYITRRNALSNVLKGIELASNITMKDNNFHVKINCVVMNGFNVDEINTFVEYTRNNNIQVRFIEYMPFDGNRWNDSKFYSYQDTVAKIREEYPEFQKLKANQGHDVAKLWQVPGFKGKVGFISSMSDHFCSTCTRLRVTADGHLKTCLFGHEEVSLRDALRLNLPKNDIDNIIQAAVSRKQLAHGGMSDMFELNKQGIFNRPMTTIGG